MKKIGFIDYYLDEWHANNYPAWIEECNKKNGTDYKLCYAWGEVDGERTGMSNSDWCKNNGVCECSSIEEVCEKSDNVILLAPSNPEKHLEYAKRIFECGVSPYIDKTFAQDLHTAEKIFELAKINNVKFFSSSALRYADELSEYNGDALSVVTTGGGRTIDEYIIHQIEMAVKVLGVGANAVRYERYADEEFVDVFYENKKHAKLLFSPCMPFHATVADKNGNSEYHSIDSAYFKNLISDILNFFDTGKTSFDKSQTLEVMKIRDGILNARNTPSEIIKL